MGDLEQFHLLRNIREINKINMKFDPSFCHNEREVESKLIVSYLLPKLGYTLELWRQERKLNRFRLDFSAYKSYSSLKKELFHVLSNIGINYKIEFS